MAGTVQHDEETDTYYADCDWSEAVPSMKVIEVVATALDCEEVDVPQLYTSVDPDALDQLVEGSTPRTAEVSFEHAGCQVSVASGGRISVRRTDQ